MGSMSDRCGLFSRSSHPEVFLVKGVLKICSKFTGEHQYWSVISIKLHCSFIEIILRHGCSPVNLLYIFRTPFTKNTSGWLLLVFIISASICDYRSNDITFLILYLIKISLSFSSDLICDFQWTSLILFCNQFP